MKKILRTAVISFSALAITVGVQAKQEQFDNVFFFGDSLTDVGNNPSAPRTNDRGPLWSNNLAAKYGFKIKPSLLGGTDYAVFGFTSEQILNATNGFIAQSGGHLNPGAAYFTWSGNNDLLDAVDDAITNLEGGKTPEEVAKLFAEDLEVALATGPTNVVTGINNLNKAGAKYQIVMNIPNLGKLPLENLIVQFAKDFGIPADEADLLGNVLRAAMTESSLAYNDDLRKKINALPFDVVQVDIFTAMDAILANPEKYGLNNVSGTICKNPLLNNACTPDQTTDLNPETTLFFDEVHPSQVGHILVSDMIFSYLQAPTLYSLLTRSPINALQGQYANIESQFLPVRGGQNMLPGKWNIFASGSVTPQRPGALGTLAPNYKSYNQNLTLGAVNHINEMFSVGVAGGASFGRTESSDYYQFDLSEPMITLFGEVRPWRFYMNAEVTYGAPTFYNIQRSIKLFKGMSTSNKASTKGQHFGTAFNAGANAYKNDKFSTGPVTGIEYQYVKVGGYREDGLTEGLNLDFFDTSNESLLSHVGWQGTFTTPVGSTKLLFNANAKYNYQHLGGRKDIRFSTVSLAGSHGAIPVAYPKGGYGTAGGGIGASFADKFMLFFQANTVFANKDFSQQVYSLTATLPL